MDISYNEAVAGGLLIIAISVLVIIGLVMVFFLFNLRALLNQVRPQNRAMQPNMVWLNLIPVFNYVWLIYTVIKVRDSVDSEFRSRGWAAKGDNGFGVGLAFAILWVLAGVWLAIPFLVCWIVYWMKTAELKRLLEQSQPPAGWAPLAPPPVGGEGDTSDRHDASVGDTDQTSGWSEQKDCPYCGRPNRPDARFCNSCGRPIA